ncbi:MAG TPA: ABC transporter permease [Cyclobacteriaceae bacterium]|nr:ABC transporter permease [Cyclobacteriaceae bacterium]
MNGHPPKLARKIFEWFCGNAKVEDLLGDLDEWFYVHVQSKSLFRARVLYWKQIYLLMFSYALKKRKRDAQLGQYSSSGFSFDMLHNYLKVAVRNLYQYKYFSIINAFGLAVGMTVSLLLISLVTFVRTYEDFHTQGDHIYTIVSERTEGIEESIWATAPFALAQQLQEHPDVQEVVRIQANFREEIKHAQGTLSLRGYYVEPDFLKVFTYEITQGNAVLALTKPNSMILTESAAMKFFNSTEVLGKTLELEHGELMEVAAVMKDHPINSHLKFDVLVSYATLPPVHKSLSDQWTNYDREYLYVLLTENGSQKKVEEHLNKIAADAYATLPVKVNFATKHIREIAMGPDYRMAIGPKWEASGMIVFGVIALLILLPACFNYTNISIARALKRAKEIGLRKTMGGQKNQIFFQFITETVVITLVSLAGAILIFFLIRPEFLNSLVASSSLDLSLTPRMLLYFILFALGTGLVAGIFPALYFGGLNPIQALKNKAHAASSGMRVRKVLTIFQFALSFGFILCLVVFSRQYQYSINFDFGFDKENIVDVQLQGVNAELVKTEFSKLASVQSVAMSSQLMGLSYSKTWVKNADKDSSEVNQLFVDRNCLSMFNLTLLAGKNFPEETWQRERFIIVNEEFLKHYKIETPVEAIGRTYLVEGNELEVVGVVKNFHFASLRYPIDKFFFRMNPEHFVFAHLKVNTRDAFAMFTEFENHWKILNPEQKLEADFFEEELSEGYSSYVVMIKIVGFLGLLAITISLLGMLGMVVYTSETKAKEVSIRKVMGASVYNLAFLLSKDYLKLMVWAILFAVPITTTIFYLLFPKIQYYSVSLTVWDVLLSAMVLLGLGIATITSQTYKTALTNPAETLKGE